MSPREAVNELRKVHFMLAKKGGQIAEDNYLKEQLYHIRNLNKGRWNRQAARDYIDKLKTSVVDIESIYAK